MHISSSFNFHICVQNALAGLQRMEAAQDGMESGYDMQVRFEMKWQHHRMMNTEILQKHTGIRWECVIEWYCM